MSGHIIIRILNENFFCGIFMTVLYKGQMSATVSHVISKTQNQTK